MGGDAATIRLAIQWKQLIDRIRQAIRDERYRLSAHAIEELAEDGLESEDVEEIIFTGAVAQTLTHDSRGTQYEVCGRATDGRGACLVCRFLASGVLLIITVYALPE